LRILLGSCPSSSPPTCLQQALAARRQQQQQAIAGHAALVEQQGAAARSRACNQDHRFKRGIASGFCAASPIVKKRNDYASRDRYRLL